MSERVLECYGDLKMFVTELSVLINYGPLCDFSGR
jgi:hypothetical protein